MQVSYYWGWCSWVVYKADKHVGDHENVFTLGTSVRYLSTPAHRTLYIVKIKDRFAEDLRPLITDDEPGNTLPIKDPVISYTATGNAALVALALVLAVVFSYIAQAWKMDRESENLMKALDLEVAPEFFGPKRIDVYGRLRRADTSVICKSATTDWSNSATCLSNANLHANVLSSHLRQFSFSLCRVLCPRDGMCNSARNCGGQLQLQKQLCVPSQHQCGRHCRHAVLGVGSQGLLLVSVPTNKAHWRPVFLQESAWGRRSAKFQAPLLAQGAPARCRSWCVAYLAPPLAPILGQTKLISPVGSLEETSITLVPPQQNVYPHAHQAIQRLLSRAWELVQRHYLL